jgi:hypothetical protein
MKNPVRNNRHHYTSLQAKNAPKLFIFSFVFGSILFALLGIYLFPRTNKCYNTTKWFRGSACREITEVSHSNPQHYLNLLKKCAPAQMPFAYFNYYRDVIHHKWSFRGFCTCSVGCSGGDNGLLHYRGPVLWTGDGEQGRNWRLFTN